MKTKKFRRAAFVNLRTLLASLLCLTAVLVTLFAFGSVAQQRDGKGQTTGISRLCTRLASSLGIGARSQPAGAIKVDKDPAERPPGATRPPTGPYPAEPVNDLRGVTPVRSEKLRDLAPINPDLVPKVYHQEPIRPKPPTQSGGPKGPIQTVAGPLASAPSPTGLSFDGVGVGLAGFSPSSNPPDVNGRVGSTQYVQWNNTSFAVFDKTTGALQYGPAAGSTLFQALGGACAAHNDGDPVVSYDILAGRWILSQFVVDGGPGSFSHQCFAVSATSDATGEYYLYDFTTDPVNFVDYPHTGVWPDGYYMSAHVFNPAGTFTTGRIYVFERDKMILGQVARMQSQNLGTEYGFLPADLDSLTPPAVGEAAFLLGPNFGLTELTDTFRVATTWGAAPAIVVTPGTPIMGGIGIVPCVSGATADGRDCVPQPPPAIPTDYLDNLSSHYMYRLAYRNQGTQAAPQERLVVSGPSDSSDVNHGAVEWFEFRNAGSSTTQPTLFQSGIYDPDTSFRWMPSIAMDKDGNIALGYSKSSTTIFPGIYLTGRLATDTAGTMGAEVQMQAGIGSQLGAGNRWGDYSGMTLDPIDQCTFYYTNEYLKTNGGFNWSTRIAAFKFPSCVSAAGLWGTVTGTITSSQTSAPISGVTVTLNNGYAGASNASGIYTILVPAGSYTATAADPSRNCTSASPASANVTPPGGGMVTQNFAMTGTSKLEANGITINDSLGNGNGIVNRAECVLLNLGVKNNGCATETAISATLTTTTPGVTVVNGNSSYSDMVIDAGGTNATPFKISVSDTFGCGTEIALSLNLTYAGGTKSIPFTIPTCTGGPDQQILPTQITTSDSTQPDRMGRDGRPGICFGKTCPGPINTAGTRNFKTFTFTNNAGAPRCFTVTINAALGGAGDIQSAAYQTAYTPPVAMGDPTGNMCLNYLGDSGVAGLGTTLGTASYSFTVPAQTNFVIVVNTVTGSTNSSVFSGTVSGFTNNTPGPGACSGAVSPTPTPTATPTASPSATATATPATPTPSPTPATPTPTPTPATPTPTPATPTPTPATPTPTPATPTPTPTPPTPTPTPASPTPTPTPATPTPSPTPATPTPTPTPATPTPTVTPSPSPCGAIIFSENFDGGSGLPPFWSGTIVTGTPPGWVISTVTPDTPPNCAFVNDQDGVSDKVLDSPNIAIPPTAAAQLTFRNYYNTEHDPPPSEVFWDGGVLEVSINGGAFQDVTAPTIGGSFVTGGYTGEIDGTAGNPLAGRLAWSGDSGGYITTVINFGPNINGQTIKLRFRMGTDEAVAAPGWRVDTILITAGPCPSPTPSPSPTVTPGTPTPTPTVTPSTPTPTPTVTPATPTPTPTPVTPTPTPATPTPTATPSTPTPTPSATATPTASPTPTPASQTVNLSTRMRVQTGDNVGIGGFIISGSVPKRVLLRAIGPSITGLAGLLADPVLELHGPAGFTTIVNNNWRDTQEAEIQATGIAPVNNLEAAIIGNLAPGAYTGIVSGNGNTSGIALVEVYDLNQAVAAKLANISTRALVGTGDNIVIAGFILGNNPGNDRIVVRGIGPSLTALGVPNALANPTLELRDNNGTLLFSNNDWQDNQAQAAELIAAGLAPTNPLESGIAATLPPGLYTALLAGLNNGSGVGLVEVYDRGGGP